MVSDGTAPYHAVYSIHERHYTMNPSLLLSPEMVAQGKEIQAELKLLELELSKGIQIDLTGLMNSPFVLP
jgi:hypothetical protein